MENARATRGHHIGRIDDHAALVKLAEPRPRTLRTKVIEAVTALWLEQLWTKEQIFAAYVNRLDVGKSL